MKVFNVLAAAFVLIVACKEAPKTDKNTDTTQEEAAKVVTYNAFGEAFEQDNPLLASAMGTQYQKIQGSDSLNTQFTAKVKEVCSKKGCWMRLELADGQEAIVRFKDYGFFVPKNIAGSTVVVNGKAFVTTQTIEELRHYAEDAGKSEEEIAAITEPKTTYGFLADGVLLEVAQGE
jgi:hypothetical protein